MRAWLASHLQISIIARDQSGCVLGAAATAAREAIQAADRWRLMRTPAPMDLEVGLDAGTRPSVVRRAALPDDWGPAIELGTDEGVRIGRPGPDIFRPKFVQALPHGRRAEQVADL